MRRRKTAIFFLVLGICLTVLAVALNIGWIILNLRQVVFLVLGIIFFALIITGLILNTIFLVREIRRNEQHDAFLNAVTHELKTPIASIKLYLDTLRARDLSPEKREEFYEIMMADNDRLLMTVEQVLQAGRTREKKRQVSLSRIEIGGVLSEAIALVRSRYHLADGVVRLSEPSEPLELIGDRDELQTAFTNLLDNAVKYSADTPKISIRAKRSTLKNNIDIVLKDNGVGIDPAELKRIFRRFYRAAPGEQRGTGLGLAIVKSIIEKHGGRV
ncbi:MAG: HAMP domain-containing histidine kinase, partial [Acidobacteria bacterium]|nr:HAMP domain-containing histidine kinase [Acidobacteriota bacterium]MCA1607977.1 HAMP domain-containing histidine kinase [Acidobacteriota bacterium]